MDQNYLKQLIEEVKVRNGGLILNLDGRPEAVVLSIEKYNEMVANVKNQESAEAQSDQSLFKPKTVLVTGGAGYIGAHLTKQLLNAGNLVVVIDNLSTGKRENVPEGCKFIEGDVGDVNLLRDIFANHKIDCVMHLAASIEVEESVLNPAKYLENNAINTARLLFVMEEAKVKKKALTSILKRHGLDCKWKEFNNSYD